VSFDSTVEPLRSCRKARLGLVAENGEINWYERDFSNLKVTVLASATGNGVLRAVIEVGPFPKPTYSPNKPLTLGSLCRFKINSFDIN
jgi:hypothetical protein